MWQFLSMTRASLAMLAFRMLDTDKNGTLDGGEIMQMLTSLAGSEELAKKALAEMALAPAPGAGADTAGGEGKEAKEAEAEAPAEISIDEEAFLAFALAHPAVTQPALKLQALLREKICGAAFWEQALLKRGQGKELEAQAELERARAFAIAA